MKDLVAMYKKPEDNFVDNFDADNGQRPNVSPRRVDNYCGIWVFVGIRVLGIRV